MGDIQGIPDIRGIQLEAVEKLTREISRIDHAVATMKDLKNDFEIEARLYVISNLSVELGRHALKFHSQLHEANSGAL